MCLANPEKYPARVMAKSLGFRQYDAEQEFFSVL